MSLGDVLAAWHFDGTKPISWKWSGLLWLEVFQVESGGSTRRRGGLENTRSFFKPEVMG